MTRPTIARAMWANRPTAPELLFWTLLVAVGHWWFGLPLLLLSLAVVLLLIGGTLQVARTEVRKAAPAPRTDDEGGGRDAT